jgi:lysophospholipase III
VIRRSAVGTVRSLRVVAAPCHVGRYGRGRDSGGFLMTSRFVFFSRAHKWSFFLLKEVETGVVRASDVYIARHGMPDAASMSPVILFPGLGGSGLQVEIDKNYKKAWECFQKWNWWGIWVNIYEIAFQTCWFDNLQLHYTPGNDTFQNNPGVFLKPNDFGGLNGVNKLDHFDDLFGLTDVYQPMIEEFEKVGYVGGKNLFGAPYDWRLPVNVLMSSDILGIGKTYEQALVALLEQAYHTNNDTPVTIITHSMGGPTALYFLNHQEKTWREKYVATFIPIAGPWAGSAKALKALVSGDNLGLQVPLLDWSLLSMKDLTHNFRQYGGGAFLVPDPY